MKSGRKSGGLRLNQLDALPERIQTQIQAQLSSQGRVGVSTRTSQSKKVVRETVPETSSSESPIHEMLWQALSDIDGVCKEFKGAVPGRRFRLDIAFPDAKLAVEVDGWQYHGKYKEAHAKDRERQNLLTLQGWHILRFTASQIMDNAEACALIVTKVLLKLKQN